MKTLTAFHFFVIIATTAFAQQTPPIPLKEWMQQVENNLLPNFIIEGDTLTGYNLEERMKFHNVPGVSIAIIKDGKIHWAKSYGYADKEVGRKVVLGTLFQAASISKPVAATAALQLVEKGKIQLDSNINKYLKSWKVPDNEFTKTQKVTLRRLVTHAAGLTVHGFRGYAKGEAVPTTVQVLEGKKPTNSPAILPDIIPGSSFRYSGGGYTVMQQMLEDMTGKPFAELLQKNVLAKAGMTNSTYEQPLPTKFHASASHAYHSDGKKVKGNWHTYPEKAAAGLWTTPSDLANFIITIQQSLQGKSNLLSKKTTEAMLTKHLNDMGLGPGLTGEGDSLIFSHNGGNEGFRCRMMGFAHLGSGVVVMTNSDNGMPLINEITRSVSKVYHWNTEKPKVKKRIALDAVALEKFAGTYQTDEDGKIKMEVGDNQLIATQSWDGNKIYFYPEAATTFFSPDNGYNIKFNLDATDVIESATINGGLVIKKVKD